MGLSPIRFVVGSLVAAATVAFVVLVAVRVRRAFVPEWSGAVARLADAVVGLSLVLAAAQLAGALQMFHAVGMLVAIAALCAAMWFLTRWATPRVREHVRAPVLPYDDSRSTRLEQLFAATGVGVVVVQWCAASIDALGRGMVHPDTHWYHMPFAIRFVQEHAFTGLDGVGYPEARWFPFDSQVLHALGIITFGRDVLSPFLNLGWLALAFGAAWCVGRHTGAAYRAVLAAAVACSLPILSATQPGQASSDIACAALLLAAVALVLESDLDARRLAFAGLAAGLAIGTKVTIAAPFAVLVVGVVVVALLARKVAAAGTWLAAVVVTGSFWFARDWVLAGSPLPWFGFGPFDRAVEGDTSASLSATLTVGYAWRDIYLPGLWQAFGRLWPLVVALAVGGAVLACVRGSALVRVCALAALAGWVGHIWMPLTGGFSFVFNLRYLGPVVLLGFVLGATFLASSPLRNRVQLAVWGLLLVVSATMPHRERIPAWPGTEVWIALGVLAVAGGLALLLRRADGPMRWIALGATALVVATGWYAAQRVYLERRFVDAQLPADDSYAWFRDVRDAWVAVFGTDETYPMFGLDLSNEVRRGDDPLRVLDGDPCRAWKRELNRRGYDFVFITHPGFGLYFTPPSEMFADPAAHEVQRQGDSVVYQLDGPLDGALCP